MCPTTQAAHASISVPASADPKVLNQTALVCWFLDRVQIDTKSTEMCKISGKIALTGCNGLHFAVFRVLFHFIYVKKKTLHRTRQTTQADPLASAA